MEGLHEGSLVVQHDERPCNIGMTNKTLNKASRKLFSDPQQGQP